MDTLIAMVRLVIELTREERQAYKVYCATIGKTMHDDVMDYVKSKISLDTPEKGV